MTRRHEEIASSRMLAAVEQLAGGRLDEGERRMLLTGPREIDFVQTALAETMETAYHQVHGLWRSRGLPDLRTAAFVFALERVAGAYLAQGIFP
jgi:glutamate dehydrogenase (NAD(P)+)